MKKIMLALSGPHFSEGAFSFIEEISQHDRILLTGVFLPEVRNVLSVSGGLPTVSQLEMMEKEDEEAVQRNIDFFKLRCKKTGIDYTVHNHFYGLTFEDLERESRFADLMVIGSETFYPETISSRHIKYLKEALHRAECPILLVPEKYIIPSNILLAYDGTASSVYAMKLFALLFPERCKQKSLLVYASTKGGKIPHKTEIEELARLHFEHLQIKVVDATPQEYFNETISNIRNELLVTGSYGRTWVSELFRKSTIDRVIRQHHIPVFIAHK
jgi:nucleotide-binding universal stress UspA family protein